MVDEWRRRSVPGLAMAVCGLLVAVFSWSPAPASANWVDQLTGTRAGPCDHTLDRDCRMNDRFLYWDADLGPLMTTAIIDTLYNSYHTTNIDVSISGTVNDGYHDAQASDVYYHNAAGLDPGVYGVASCEVGNGTHVCQHTHVHFRAGMSGDASFLKSIACHETGHAVGLTHPGSVGAPDIPDIYRCMTNGSTFPPSLGPHNVGHIDGNFF